MQIPDNSCNTACLEEELELAAEFSWTLYAHSRLAQYENAENIECVNDAEFARPQIDTESDATYF